MHELCGYSECCYSLSVLFAELLPRTQTSLSMCAQGKASHGPLRFITSYSFRARLCHAKNEALEEEAGRVR